MNKAVLIEIQDSIAIITLNRPDRYNSVNQDLLDGFNESFSIVENDDSIRAVVLTGNGKGFCAGADMSTFGLITPEQSRDYIVEKYKPLMKRFLGLKKPIIGAINGTAAGVGAAFALACDFRVMSKESAILYAFINIGLGPDGGASWLLSRQVGYSKALEIASSGKKVLGEECLSLGLTNKLVDNSEILDSAKKWAFNLSKKATIAIGITKQDMIFSLDNNLYDTIEFEAKEQVAAFYSHDLKEGVNAFLEKRKAKFSGK
ncbi:MAG: enoyl-CoA hydratase/isomerase family protein [Flavobacteriaceae bacterium]|jgi:enoyl-CoA hydratase/carnithine racemase|nr:enoyl-CoA hydratase/isomerase family protein [Flavobacteriaceae bacterium]MBT5012001.1 enoyl-CoA hydratase/isomerase family protein [Flavobacteriaceae bacterium]MBT5395732.1 enoyl-CoA hydratase/isomerase family protein [Flavobacteriaceae bacterium]MBT5596006.1 enoyl-CoA hydratase/isomerase family protein [Flavobacteriaceae bacterium]MBT6689493.1 enoyl-CoA hydratase/isomerase family protein [Flavobacteriaceae bacterium]